jgi:DNA-binding MarR family transcriptional regulator
MKRSSHNETVSGSEAHWSGSGDDSADIGDAALASLTIDDSELAARLRLVLNRLARRLRSQAANDLGPGLLSALVSIETCGPLTLGQLASRENVKPPSVTRMVATMERLGLVHREVDAHDRRIARVSLTAEGRHRVQQMRTRKTAYLAKRLRKLDDADLSVMREALPVLERLLEDDR